ncbi:flagellar sheath protein A [Vibrio pelagius]|uniref:Flagellar sheath protein A n=1 Tax=Vibrio pelagius TaxID=28169 RepID=A0ABY5G4N2_VIBPE|nr:flagellar sheath protein A [Vibrio pelagius]UTT85103.1 flagellar sheath protein A [Vibrio pelagius]
MKKTQILPLAAIISGLLVGCGGGGGGGGGGVTPVTPKYTWQMLSLNSVERSAVASGCSIVAQDESDANGTKVIAAYKATANFNILFHDENGVITATNQSDANGRFVIDSGEVPDGGYVSLEEIDGSIQGTQDVYMFTVSKELLSDMTLNVRQHSSTYSCYQGEQSKKANVDQNAAVKVDQVSSDTSYYQTSYIDNATSGKMIASGIPVNSDIPASDNVLVTLFESYNGTEARDLSHYVVVDASYVYDSSQGSGSKSGAPTDENLVKPTFTAAGLTLKNTSKIDVEIDNEIHTWQSIYESGQVYGVIDGTSPIDNWSFNIEANTDVAFGNWDVKIYDSVDSTGTTVALPTLSTLTASITTTGCTGYCLSADGYVLSEYQIQRTHLRSSNENKRNFYQTIFAAPNKEQVLMNSTDEELSIDNNNDRLEVSLAQLDTEKEAQVKQFFAQNIDPQVLISSTVPNYNDVNGLLSMASDDKLRRIEIMGNEVQFYQQGVN